MAPQESAVCVWDFTLKCTNHEEDLPGVLSAMKEHSKKYCFQLERGESGYEHYQGRISLKQKLRKPQLLGLIPGDYHWTVTSSANRDNQFYVMKPDTRIAGPWTDQDPEPEYIPRQIRGIKLRPWQQQIVDDAEVWDTRHINIIYDEEGGNGKTTIKTYVRCMGIGRFIPFVNDYRDMMRIVMDTKTERLYIIDIPRAIQKDRLYQFFAGIESLKDGYAYDDRYHFKDKCFDCPNVWVFTNRMPDTNMLSADRWKMWSITEEGLTRIF